MLVVLVVRGGLRRRANINYRNLMQEYRQYKLVTILFFKPPVNPIIAFNMQALYLILLFDPTTDYVMLGKVCDGVDVDFG